MTGIRGVALGRRFPPDDPEDMFAITALWFIHSPAVPQQFIITSIRSSSVLFSSSFLVPPAALSEKEAGRLWKPLKL